MVGEYPVVGDAEVSGIIRRSHSVYGSYRLLPLADRTAILARIAQLHRKRIDEHSALQMLEVGKPIRRLAERSSSLRRSTSSTPTTLPGS
jgi:succinate-semialdehyde dehydrogenase/glutarate-semialdehyde dehydrogenase